MLTWEGNYILNGREALLEVQYEEGDPSTGIGGRQITNAKVDGLEVSGPDFERISSDPALYDQIEEARAFQFEQWAERE